MFRIGTVLSDSLGAPLAAGMLRLSGASVPSLPHLGHYDVPPASARGNGTGLREIRDTAGRPPGEFTANGLHRFIALRMGIHSVGAKVTSRFIFSCYRGYRASTHASSG